MRMGKPFYICPEAVMSQVKRGSASGRSSMPQQTEEEAAARGGSHELDLWARDCWSLGVMLFILLIGCPPYSSPDCPAFAFLCRSCVGDPPACRLERLVERYCGDLGAPCPSEAAMDMLQGMLDVNPCRRLTLEQIICHPWLAVDPSPL